MRTRRVLLEELIRTDLKIEDIDVPTKKRLRKDGCELLGFATEASDLYKEYLPSDNTSVFDFSGDRFRLWAIKKDEGPKFYVNREYGHRTSRICVVGFLQAAKYGWIGKTVGRDKFKDKVTDVFPTVISSQYVNQFLHSVCGREVFGHNKPTETVKIEYILRGIVV